MFFKTETSFCSPPNLVVFSSARARTIDVQATTFFVNQQKGRQKDFNSNQTYWEVSLLRQTLSAAKVGFVIGPGLVDAWLARRKRS
jgi:hypothetical protein